MERNLLGVIFSRLRNTREKWLALLKPLCSAICSMESAEPVSSTFAWRRRCYCR